jgi:hypothetical protein
MEIQHNINIIDIFKLQNVNLLIRLIEETKIDLNQKYLFEDVLRYPLTQAILLNNRPFIYILTENGAKTTTEDYILLALMFRAKKETIVLLVQNDVKITLNSLIYASTILQNSTIFEYLCFCENSPIYEKDEQGDYLIERLRNRCYRYQYIEIIKRAHIRRGGKLTGIYRNTLRDLLLKCR